jgi:tetratricopeptide (TPR) repeat protein
MLEVLINNRYMLESELGRGGMGVVYRARDSLLDRYVAVKVLWTSGLGSQGRARLLREAQAAARLNHPNIINIFDAGDADGLSYIIMELLDGESLYEYKPKSLEDTLEILRQICLALEHAHANGIIHRDLKPENVIVTSQGIAKLTDFGLSRSVTARISQEGIVGTVYYLAPEQALRQDVDARADLYSLGILMYELTTGRLPFNADDPLGVISQHLNATVVPPSTHNAAIPPALDALILQLLSKRPEDRPVSAAEVREALSHVFDTDAAALCALPGLSPLDRLARGRLVGRQEEFSIIKNMWQNVQAGYGQENVAIVSGEPGVGKTPLVKELRSIVQISGGRSYIGESYARGSAPYAAIAQILQSVQVIPEGLPDLVWADLHTLSPDLAGRQVPVNPPLSPISEQQRLFESVFTLFSTLAERQPIALIVEDIQWADSNTLLLLRHLARRARATHLRLMILLTYRQSELADDSNLRDVLVDLHQDRLAEQIDLKPFNREQTRELLAAMFMQDITDKFLDAIFSVTEGNLFFIEEICKALIEEGDLYCDDGEWHFSGIEALEMPQSVLMALQLRINRLPPFAQDVLRMASVVGREFDYEVLRRSCENHDEDTLIEAIELAERAQLLIEVRPHEKNGRQTTERFAFAHALIPTTLREEISSLRRHRIHRRVAAAIESVSPDDLEALAYHYTQAGDNEKARYYLIRAGDRAAKLYANAEALSFYSQAMELTPEHEPDRFHILQGRAQVYDMLAQRGNQRADIEEMLNLADLLGDETMHCDALIALANFFLLTENLLANEPARKAAEIAQKIDDPVREARALRCQGWNAYMRHNYHESLRALESAVTRFHQAGLPAQASECLHMLSLVTGMQGLGELQVSQKFAENAIQLARLAGDPRQEAISLRRLAIVHMDEDQCEQALVKAQQALALHRELGDRYEECMALNSVGVILARLGRHDEVRPYFQQSHEMATAMNSKMGTWIAFSNLQWFYYRRIGDFETSLAEINKQIELPETQSDSFLLMNMLQLKAQVLSQLGQHSAALETLEQVRKITDKYASPVIRASLQLDIARALAELRRFDEAHTAVEEARQMAGNFERASDMAELLTTAADIARREWEAGNLTQLTNAAGQIEQAIKLLKGANWRYQLAEALQTAAWVALARNQAEQALQYSQQSVDILAAQAVQTEGYLYCHVCALWANGRDEEADTYLQQAYQRVIQVAHNIRSDELRRSWLEDVYLNRQIIRDAGLDL